MVDRPRILWGFLSSSLTKSDAVDVVFQDYCTNMTPVKETEPQQADDENANAPMDLNDPLPYD